MIQLLLMASHSENEWVFMGKKYQVEAGQFITALDSIQEKCSKDVSIQNIRTCLLKLEKHGFLTNESTNKNRLITIVNWGFYQGDGEELTSNSTGSQQATNKQLTAINNVKNSKNKESLKPSCPKQVFDDKSFEFRLANYLLENILKFKPDLKKPNLQTWAKHIDYLIRLDGREPKQIGQVIEWATKDSFFQTIIFSTENLRKQWDRVTAKMKQGNLKPTNAIQNKNNQTVERIKEAQARERIGIIDAIRIN